MKNNILLFSPSVAKNTQGYYWFDIREANIAKKEELNLPKCHVLIRIVSDKFILVDWEDFKALLKNPKTEIKTGKHAWEIRIEEHFSILRNKRSKDTFISVQCLEKQAVIEKFENEIKG